VRSLVPGFFAALVLAALGSLAASAQTIPFTLLATSNGSSVTVLNDGSIGITAQVGTQAQVVVTATYTGTSQATFSTKPQSVGSTQFSVALTGTLPIVLSPGQALTFTVTYAPTNANGATTQVTVPFTEPGSTGTPVSNAIVLVFQGNSPSFVLSYILQANNNTVVIPPGGTIPFLPTQINTTANANLDITNQGSGPGTITVITPPAAGSPFKLSGTPLLPATLTSGQFLQLTVSYTPTAVQSTPDMGQVTITFENGITDTVLLSGTGSTSSFTYNVISGGTTTPVKPPGPIVLPAVNVATSGSTAPSSSVIVQVVNSGNASGTINSISVSGQGFQLVNPPTTAPVLAPGGPFSFAISYTPTQVGPQTGTLEIGNDMFTLSGTGLGPQLTFSYVSNGATIPASGTTGVVFPSIAVSKSESVTFTVTNSGTLPATITLITASPTPPFSVPTLPPATLAPGQMTSFPITFTPTTAGPVTGSLSVNGAAVPLFGAGSTPPTLPSYTIAGPSGNVAPLSQAGVTLTLANSYPVDLQGVLTLTTSGNYGTDPAVQFSTGSSAGNRTVDFVIPAGSTNANFAGQGSQILLQTGTVAETVTLTPTFATTTGGVDITPSPAPTLQFTVASSAPVLLSLQIGNETASSFTLVLIGYSTTRSLSSLNVTFNPAAGFNLGATQFTIDLSSVSTLWFASTASQSFGGQFEISVPFQLTGTVRAGSTLIQTIASLSATVGNALGVSNLLETNVQ